MSVTLADQSVVRASDTISLPVRMYDDRGCVIPAANTEVPCYVLDELTLPVVLGMLWLQTANPNINWEHMLL